MYRKRKRRAEAQERDAKYANMSIEERRENAEIERRKGVIFWVYIHM